MTLRRLRVAIGPTTAARALGRLRAACTREGWPADWAWLQNAAEATAGQIADETARIGALVEDLESARGVVATHQDVDLEATEGLDLGWAALEIDLRVLWDDAPPEAAARVAQALVALMHLARASEVYTLEVRVGTRPRSVDAVVAALERQARARDGTTHAVHGFATGEQGGDDDPEDVSDDDPDDGPDDAAEDFWEAAQRTNDAARRADGPGRGELTDDERLFLARADELFPPASRRDLDDAWRRVVLANHPDRHPDDPAATTRFVALRRGYEALVRRIDAR